MLSVVWSPHCGHLIWTVSSFWFFLTTDENWRNKNPPPKVVTISKSTRANKSLLNPSVEACKSIISLKNGHLSFGKPSIQTFNTCPFDSVYSVVAGMYTDFEMVKNQIDQIENCEFSKMVSQMFDDDSKALKPISMAVKQNSLLRQRNKILNNIFEGTKRIVEFDNMRSINCSANVNYIIQKMLPTDLFSYTRKKQCDCCVETHISKRCFIDINFEEYALSPIQSLNECLLNAILADKRTVCPCGGSRNIVETNFSSFIMIDLQLEYRIKTISLNDIPKTLNLFGVEFALYGCIEYIGEDIHFSQNSPDDDSEQSIGHYVAHIYRRNNLWELYDDLKSHVPKSNTIAKVKGQVLFYVKK